MKHIISVLVENKFGVLSRVSGLFSSRGFNIHSLTVSETEDPTISRMTIVVDGDDRILEQVVKQLNKLIDTIKVNDLTDRKHINRELLLIKASMNNENREHIFQLANVFKANIVDISTNSITLQAVGTYDKITALIDLIRPYGIKETVRTGRVAISRDNIKAR